MFILFFMFLVLGFCEESPDLEVVLFGFASHDNIEGLIGVFCSVLDAVGHVLLVLVWVEPYAERPGVPSEFGLRIRTLSIRTQSFQYIPDFLKAK